MLDETVALAARIAAHPRAATRAITSLLRAAPARRGARGQPPRTGGLRDAARCRGRSAARWPSSPPGLPPGPDRAPRHHRRPDRRRPGTGRPGRRGRRARLRLALPARAHPSPRRGGHAPGAGRRRAPRRLQTLPRPTGRARHGRRGDDAHRARHRHPARRAARPHPAGQAGGDTRSPQRWAGHARGRVRLEPHRGRGPRRRLAPPPRGRARAPRGHGGHLVRRPVRVPRRVRRLRPDVVLAQAGAAPAGAHPRRRRRHRDGASAPSSSAPTAGSRSAGVAWARPSRGCTRWPRRAGRDPAGLCVVPFGTIADRGKLEHFAGLGITEVVLRVRAGDERSVRAELESLAPLVPFAATLEQP